MFYASDCIGREGRMGGSIPKTRTCNAVSKRAFYFTKLFPKLLKHRRDQRINWEEGFGCILGPAMYTDHYTLQRGGVGQRRRDVAKVTASAGGFGG